MCELFGASARSPLSAFYAARGFAKGRRIDFRLITRYHDNKGNHEIVLDKLECAHD